jgi:hypothetical protein
VWVSLRNGGIGLSSVFPQLGFPFLLMVALVFLCELQGPKARGSPISSSLRHCDGGFKSVVRSSCS